MPTVSASRANRQLRNRSKSNGKSGMLDLGEALGSLKLVDSLEEGDELQTGRVGQVPEDMYDKDELKQFLIQELYEADGERSDLVQRFRDYEEIYKAPLPRGEKKFPFKGASNLVIPMAKEFIDTNSATLAQTVLIPGPTWIQKATADEWRPFKSLIEVFMDLAGRRELKIPDRFNDFIIEGHKLGTGILESSHEFIERIFYNPSQDGKRVERVTKVVKSGPELWFVPTEDFYIRMSETDIQTAPWVAKRVRLNAVQLKQRAFSGRFDPEVVKAILTPPAEDGKEHQGAAAEGDQWTGRSDEVLEKVRELSHTEPTRPGQFDIFEHWVSWTLKGDPIETELQVYTHPVSNNILGVFFHPYRHRMRPFVKWCPWPIPGQFYGESSCERLETYQKESTTIHNQRRDSATMANLRMLSVRASSRAYRPGDPLFPGKVFMREQSDDVLPVQMGDIYPSTVTEEELSRRGAERVFGHNDAQARGGMPVTRTTFGAQAMLFQELSKRLDGMIRQLRDAIGQIGFMTFMLYNQYGAGNKPELWLGLRGGVLRAIFALPYEMVEEGIGIEAAAPTSQLNRETQRQNSLALFNLMVQLYTQLIQMLGAIVPPPQQSPESAQLMASVLGSLVVSAKQFMFDVMDQFEVTNPEEVLAGLTFLEKVLPTPEDMGGMSRTSQDELINTMFGKLDELKETLRQGVAIGQRPVQRAFSPQALEGPTVAAARAPATSGPERTLPV